MRRLVLALVFSAAAVAGGGLLLGGCDQATTCDGGELAFEDVVVGDGAVVGPESRITIDYVGRLENGQTFDQGEGRTFDIRGLIAGFRTGVLGMREGGRRTLTIPPELAYGPGGVLDGNGNVVIPPCETIRFDVTLIAVDSTSAP